MNGRSVVAVCFLLLVGFLGCAGGIAGAVQSQRDKLGLFVRMDGIQGMPPHVAVVTAALGTFRGLAVDILWARADHLQTEGEFYEAQTLAQWITTLQPRFQKVWSFQSWNLAWNIAAATQVPSERWQWVTRGIELLRAKGIPLNPRSPSLYFDLAWIFQNKIGRVGDRQHWYYKSRLANEMQEVLGDLSSGKTTEEAMRRFQRISDAPATLEQLVEQRPIAQKGIDALRKNGLAPDEQTLRMLGRVLMVMASRDGFIIGRNSLPPDTHVGLIEYMRADKEAASELIEHVVPCLQKSVLSQRYRMNPDDMADLMARYGPLDWRHPQAHAIYWAEKGVSVARELDRREDVNELMLVRGRLQTLMELMRTGRVEFDAATQRIDLLPDPRFSKFYEQAIQEAFALIASDQGVSAAEFGFADEDDLLDGYERFLNTATLFCYLYGDQEEAFRYFANLRELAARKGYGDEPIYSDTLETFVAMRFADMVQINLGDLRQALDAMLRRSFVEGLGMANFKTFNRYLGLAHAVYDKRYATTRAGEVYVLEDTKLVEFPEIVANSFKSCMADPDIALLARARIWAWAPNSIRVATYPSLAETLRDHAMMAGLDPERAFPDPGDDVDALQASPLQEAGTGSVVGDAE